MGCFKSKEYTISTRKYNKEFDSLTYNSNFNKDLLLSLPDEVIEEILSYLPFSDLYKWRNAGGRLRDCTNRVLKEKQFRKEQSSKLII